METTTIRSSAALGLVLGLMLAPALATAQKIRPYPLATRPSINIDSISPTMGSELPASPQTPVENSQITVNFTLDNSGLGLNEEASGLVYCAQPLTVQQLQVQHLAPHSSRRLQVTCLAPTAGQNREVELQYFDKRDITPGDVPTPNLTGKDSTSINVSATLAIQMDAFHVTQVRAFDTDDDFVGFFMQVGESAATPAPTIEQANKNWLHWGDAGQSNHFLDSGDRTLRQDKIGIVPGAQVPRITINYTIVNKGNSPLTEDALNGIFAFVSGSGAQVASAFSGGNFDNINAPLRNAVEHLVAGCDGLCVLDGIDLTQTISNIDSNVHNVYRETRKYPQARLSPELDDAYKKVEKMHGAGCHTPPAYEVSWSVHRISNWVNFGDEYTEPWVNNQRNAMASCPNGGFVVGYADARHGERLMCWEDVGYRDAVEIVDPAPGHRATQQTVRVGSSSLSLHACPPGMAITGIGSNNRLACATPAANFAKVANTSGLNSFASSGEKRSFIPSCPIGTMMIGFHGDVYLCGEVR